MTTDLQIAELQEELFKVIQGSPVVSFYTISKILNDIAADMSRSIPQIVEGQRKDREVSLQAEEERKKKELKELEKIEQAEEENAKEAKK